MELSEKKYDWTDWVDKNVFIKLKSTGDVYNAVVLEIVNGNKILILDKFNDKVIIDVDDILKLKELKEHKEKEK